MEDRHPTAAADIAFERLLDFGGPAQPIFLVRAVEVDDDGVLS
jgi:hypothetical protein